MNYFKNVSFMVSHVFLLSFFYLFAVRGFSKGKTVFICICSFLSLCFLDCFKLNIYPDSNFCYFIVTILQILLVQFTNIFISAIKDSRVLFMGLSASNYVLAGSITASVVYILTGSQVVSLAVGTSIHIVILLLLYAKIKGLWKKCCEKEYIGNWWELCLIPVFFYCGFSFLAFFPFKLEQNPNNILGVMVFIITMFVSYVVVLRYVESEANRNDIYWKNILSEYYIKDLENQYRSVEQFEQNLKILRHDIRHYSGMIDHLLDQKEYGEVKKIVKYINEVVDENKITKYCHNLIVNTVISNMMEKARSLDISVSLNLLIPKELPVNVYEFASVIANLFENALICAEDLEKRKKYVEVKVHFTAAHLILEFKNEYEKEIVLDSVTGLPKSKGGKTHGFGMQSVLAFADRIGGNVGCHCENGIFRIILFAKF